MTESPAERSVDATHVTFVAVVVPVHRSGHDLERCLEAVTALDPPADELVVALDGPVAGARETAEGYGFRVVETPDRAGPAGARNLGADATTAQLILFIDSDVVIPPDTVGRVVAYLAERPDVAAVFGSYDERPPASGFVSQYKNLSHHFMHQHGSQEASTFWTGCGAVRREVFDSVGGFDPGQRWLEDVELGYRMRAAGHRIHLDRTIRVTHLKRWSLWSLVSSDVLHRAWPWTELIHRYRFLPNDLNLRTDGRVSAVYALGLVVALAAMPWLDRAWIFAAGAALVLIVTNRSFYRFLWRHRGPTFALRAIPLHWLYLLYGAAAFAVGTTWWWIRRSPRVPSPAGQGASDIERSRVE